MINEIVRETQKRMLDAAYKWGKAFAYEREDGTIEVCRDDELPRTAAIVGWIDLTEPL